MCLKELETIHEIHAGIIVKNSSTIYNSLGVSKLWFGNGAAIYFLKLKPLSYIGNNSSLTF